MRFGIRSSSDKFCCYNKVTLNQLIMPAGKSDFSGTPVSVYMNTEETGFYPNRKNQ
jgi:hypothetical protein